MNKKLIMRSISLSKEANKKLLRIAEIRYGGIGGKTNQVIRDLVDEEWTRLSKLAK